MDKVSEIITTFPVTFIGFNGRLNIGLSYLTGEKLNKFLNDFNKFMSNKKVIGGLNNFKHSDQIFCSISGEFTSFSERLDERTLLEYIYEFCNKFHYNIETDRLYDNTFETQLIPIEKEPEYLYHYTNIETLALILKNRSIMFNNLSNLDDLNEGNTADLGKLGQYIFTSCWTSLNDESIPIWKMYTRSGIGVRIKLPTNFLGNVLTQHNGRYVIDTCENSKPIKVIYTDDKTYLKPKVLVNYKDNNILRIDKVGIYKKKVWEFQQEWRYIIRTIPGEKQGDFSDQQIIVENLKGGYNIGQNKLFFSISNDAFENMEITLGPMATEGDGIIVNALKEIYNKAAKLHISELCGELSI